MKRFFCIICTLFTLFTYFSFPVLAEDEKRNGSFSYEIKGNGTAVITAYDWSTNNGQDIYIPNMLDGYMVSEIGPSAFNRDYSVPTGIYYDYNSGEGALAEMMGGYLLNFADDEDIAEAGVVGEKVVVVLPNTITVIGEKAFIATRITAINIPSSVRSIGAGAFACCPNLKGFSVDSNNEVYTTIDDVLYQKIQKELVCYPLGKVTPGQSITVPEGITSIGDFAFFGIFLEKYIGHGTEIVLPFSLKRIGDYAFYYSSLGYGDFQFTLPDSVETIGEYAFAYAQIGEINWPMSLQTIKVGAFSHARLYQEDRLKYFIQLPASVTTIENYAFAYSHSTDGLGTARMLDLSLTQITSVNATAFYGVSFSEILLPETVKQIGKGSFSMATGVITIPASVEVIEEDAFSLGGGNVFFSPEASLIKIEDNAFSYYHFNGQDILVLPEGLLEIGKYAFYGAADLKILAIPDSVSTIGESVCNRADVKLEVSDGSYAAHWASENGYSTQSIGGDDASWLND